MTVKEYKQYKGFIKESSRDNMDSIELILTDLSEEATKRVAVKHQHQELDENIVTKNYKLNYEYKEEKLIK